MSSVVDFAYKIIDMQERIIAQDKELEDLRQYKQDYMELLNSTIKHGEIMNHQVMTLLLNEGKFPES